jgi:hypothetical protein
MVYGHCRAAALGASDLVGLLHDIVEGLKLRQELRKLPVVAFVQLCDANQQQI